MIQFGTVKSAVRAAEDLTGVIVAHLNPRYWSHDSNDENAADLRDYVVGVAHGVASNLRSLAVHRSKYAETRYAHDHQAGMLLTETGKPYPTPGDRRSGRYHERAAELVAYEQAFFVTLGAVLDCLATLVAGLSGLRTNVIRCDLAAVGLPTSHVESYPDSSSRAMKLLATGKGELRDRQIAALRSLAVSIDQAGNPGWLRWAIDMRNTLVHREHRNTCITFERSPKLGTRFYYLPPKDPSETQMRALRDSQDNLSDYYLMEDVGSLMIGLEESISASTIGAIEALSGVRSWRLRNPGSWADPSDQWKPGSSGGNFVGYGNAVSRTVFRNASLHMNPRDAQRLRAASVGN